MGTRLIRKEALTVFVIVVGVFFRLFDRSGKIIGVHRTVKVSSMNEFMISVWSIILSLGFAPR